MISVPSYSKVGGVAVILLLHVPSLQGLDSDYIGAARELFGVRSTRAFDGDFEGWLAAVRIDIPDQQLPHNASAMGGLQYTVRNLSCSNFGIGYTSADHPRKRTGGGLSSRIDFLTLVMELQKVTIECAAHIDYGVADWAQIALATNRASLIVKASLLSDYVRRPHIPDLLNFDTCDLHARFGVTMPEGSRNTQILGFLANGILGSILNEQLASQFCNTLLPKIKEKAQAQLINLQSYARLGMMPTNPEPYNSWNPGFVSWDEVPAIKWIQRFQEILPKPSGGFSQLVHSIFKSNHACIIQPFSEFVNKTDTDVCFTSEQKCLVGGAESNCMAKHSSASHDSPLDTFHVNLTSFNIASTHPKVTLVKGNRSMLHSGFNDTKTRLSAILNISFSGSAGGAEIYDTWGHLKIDLALQNVELAAVIQAVFDSDEFWNIKSVNYAYPGCLKSAMRKINLTNITAEFNAAVPKVTFVQPPHYASPLLLEAAELVQNFVKLVWQYEDAIPPIIRGSLLHHTQEAMASYWSNLKDTDCPKLWGLDPDPEWHIPLINPPLGAFFMWLALGVTLLACIFPVLQLCRRKRRHLVEAEEDVFSSGYTTTTSTSDDSSGEELFGAPSSLMMSDTVPRIVAWTVPLAIIACVLLLAGSNCLYFALTMFNLELGSEGTAVFELMAYNVFFSIQMLRQHGFPILAFVLFLFSGVLPYSKLIGMLLMWVLPSSLVNRSWRGRILLIVDQIGKYSLMDIFVLQFIIGCLYAKIYIPHQADGGLDISVTLRTPEERGFFCFVMATVASLIIGHICLYYHGQDPLVKAEHNAALSEKGALESDWSPKKFRSSQWWIGPVLVLLILATLVCYFLPCFSVDLSAARMTLNKNTYSLVGFAAAMPSFQLHARFDTFFGQATFILFALCTIVLHMCLLLAVWYCPLSLQWLERCRTAAHTLMAWAALDGCLISMALTLMEMDISDFHHLDENGRIAASKVLGIDVTDPRGIVISVTLEYGLYIMAVIVLVHIVVARMVMGMLEKALDGQMEIHQP